MIKTIEIEMAPNRREPTQASVVGDPAKAVPLTDLVAEIESGEGDRGVDRDFSSASFRAAMLVRTMRREASLSQRNLAAAIGVSQARVSEIEAGLGKHGPSWDVMERIAAVCGREIAVLPIPADTHSEPDRRPGSTPIEPVLADDRPLDDSQRCDRFRRRAGCCRAVVP